MKPFTLLSVIFAFIFIGCINNQTHVKYDDKDTLKNDISINAMVNDTTKAIISRLPVFFDSTDYLIHPIEIVTVANKKNRKFFLSSSDYSSRESWSGDYENYRNGDYFYGNFINLLFENTATGKQELLTSEGIKITMVQFLRPLIKKLPDSKYLLYRIFNQDTNKDNELNNGDITALFISDINGHNFNQLTKDFEAYQDGNLIVKNSRYYFRTIEDTNKDGYFNNNDTYHYYYIDFLKPNIVPTEYFPLEKIKS